MERRDGQRRRITGVAAGILLVLAGAVPAAGRTELFRLAIDLDEGGVGQHFTASSPLLCDTGEAFNDFDRAAGNFTAAITFHLDKLLVCDDGSGTFVIRIDAGSNFVTGGGTQGGWSVVPGSGTGDYVGLIGGGSLVGINGDGAPIDIVDHYYGMLRS